MGGAHTAHHFDSRGINRRGAEDAKGAAVGNAANRSNDI
jgi:hypothetical protein